MATPPEQRPGVLIIDDRENLLDAYTAWLEEDFDVYTASTGAGALEQLWQDGPTIRLVLLDVHLPDMPGLEVLRQIKALDARIVVVTLSGLPEASLEAEARQLGAAHHFIKPFDLEPALTLLQQLLV
ncbi:MAG: response regulator [Candidatus Tectimicrobiota bacterium]